ncbi:Sjogren's syndrome/scleroderma autoantigen 1 family protein [Halobaculum halobium]|uniref:Sjogren's syndrome/scleroderma autoantigen 1 family protein n=1 Tax=Halobaculum halobium TaxID=3032281 RepID=A0ABD5TED2_9EURY|nr:Sjogren's syndrome/scleroderma autoantigen 1 family protein [Halobaculum sp. SYNS20]
MSEHASDDTVDGDDSGFDKEAEREKLREKFARDDQKRQSTRRMSELLLKGATMTNDHCDACGSPIFRQNGQEFCPECDVEGSNDAVAGDAQTTSAATADAGSPGAGADGSTDARAVRDPSAQGHGPSETEDTNARARDRGAETDTDASARADRAADPTPSADAAVDATPSRDAARTPSAATADRSPGGPSRTGDSQPAGGAAGDDVAAARDALASALRRNAEAAAESSDPRVAADHLAAAREAAEALAALRR